MSVSLVEKAYEVMKEAHGEELPEVLKADEVYVHHD